MSDPPILLLSILAATAPVLLYIMLIYWVDRYEKEPGWLLAATFFWGAAPSILFAYLFNSLLSLPVLFWFDESLADLLSVSLIAPLVEESIKGLAVLGIFLLWRHEIDSILDGLIYGAMVGLGFSLVENVSYFVAVYEANGPEAWGLNIFLRGFVFGLNHALFTGMTGLGIAIARLTTRPFIKVVAPLAGWSTAVFLHFFHNFTVSFGNLFCLAALFSSWGGLLLTLGIAVWALWQERRWLRQYLAEEVALGYLSRAEYDIICSGRRRVRQQLSLLRDGGASALRQTVRRQQNLSTLAYKKHHYALFGDTHSRRFIDHLRQEIMGVSSSGR